MDSVIDDNLVLKFVRFQISPNLNRFDFAVVFINFKFVLIIVFCISQWNLVSNVRILVQHYLFILNKF